MHPTYQLVEGDQITGPHTLAVLRQKAEIHVIRPDTPVRAVVQPPEPWKPIRDWPELHDLLFIAKTAPKLGVARFHATNVETDAASAPVDVQQLLRGNAAVQKAAEKREARAGIGPYLRRRLVFAVVVALVVLPLYFVYHQLLPRTGDSIALLAGFAAVGLGVIYWVMFHVLDPR
jgi:hypothetical protein